MELEIPCCSSLEFDFNSGRTSPCDSSPSTPRGFGGGDDYFFSAPTSPMIRGGVEGYGDYLGGGGNGYGLYATNTKSKSPLNAQKFYEEGDNNTPLLPPQSPNNSTNINHKKKFWSPFSPKRKKEPLNDETTMNNNNNNNNNNKETTRTKQGRQHHRESSVLGRQVTRSLSPLRVSRYPWEEEEKEHNSTQNDSISNPPSSPTLSSLPTTPSSKGGNKTKKWRLKDLLLFRSASEGRALDNKDPWKKHLYMMQWKHNTSSISQSRKGSSSSSSSAISPHEVHYMVNKAISQDMKKKSFLPYKQGILGRLAINPTVHDLAHGFGSLAHT